MPDPEPVAIGALEGRAGDHPMLAAPPLMVDPGGDRIEPGPAVGIGERRAGAHLLDVLQRMKAVTVPEGPSEALGEALADRRLAAARHTHDDERGRALRL